MFLKWINKRLEITIKVLNYVKQEYPETRIEERLEEECFKENLSVEEVIALKF